MFHMPTLGSSFTSMFFEERVMALKKTLSFLDESKMSPYLKSTFARLIAMINKTEQKFEDYHSFFLGQMTLGNAI